MFFVVLISSIRCYDCCQWVILDTHDGIGNQAHARGVNSCGVRDGDGIHVTAVIWFPTDVTAMSRM